MNIVGKFVLFAVVLIKFSSGQFQNLIGWASRDPLVPNISVIQCSNGPPGFYCKPDLSGFIKCNNDNTQEEVTCETSKRCTCFVGAKCVDSVTDPCQEFTATPLLPKDITTVSYGHLIVRTPYTTPEYMFTKQQYQQAADGSSKQRGDRQDTEWMTPSGETKTVSFQSTFNSNGDGTFTRYVADISPPSTGTCQPIVNDASTMPMIQIPQGAQEDGTETIEGELSHRWLLMTGGQNMGMPTSTEYFYYVEDVVRNVLRPKRYYAIFDFGPTAKTTLLVNETYGLFYNQLVPSVGFYANPPASCL